MIKLSFYYLIGLGYFMGNEPGYSADSYKILLDETIRFANPISNGGTFSNCYAEKNLNANNQYLYECEYDITTSVVLIDQNVDTSNYISSLRNGNYSYFGCEGGVVTLLHT